MRLESAHIATHAQLTFMPGDNLHAGGFADDTADGANRLGCWHTTIFPPYFVAGAIFSGMSMVLTLLIVARKTMGLEDYITVGHIEKMCKLTLAVSLMVGFAYLTELFTAFYSGNPYEQFAFTNRMLGPLGWAYVVPTYWPSSAAPRMSEPIASVSPTVRSPLATRKIPITKMIASHPTPFTTATSEPRAKTR